jgi:hypothetical protein
MLKVREGIKKIVDKIFFHKIATGFEPLTFILQAYASTYEKTFWLTNNTLYQERAVFGKMKMDPAKRAQTQNAGEVSSLLYHREQI